MTDVDPLVAVIDEGWRAVERRVAAASTAADRDPATVRVVAVTKGFGPEVVAAAWHAGLTRFGENRVQEAETKIATAPNAEWHLIGHLQSNKVRRALEDFAWIEGVDSPELLDRVEGLAVDLATAPHLLLQVNVTGAPGQHGLPLASVQPGEPGFDVLADRVRAARHAPVVGFMAIGPFTADVAASRSAFARVRHLRDELEQAVGRALPELSMGMSSDLEAGVAEGATLVRVGTAIFGARPPEI